MELIFTILFFVIIVIPMVIIVYCLAAMVIKGICDEYLKDDDEI